MSNDRLTYGENANIVLFNQTRGICPICDKPLMQDKNKAKFKRYELAHIYPLNPKPEEVKLLENEEKLHTDPNHEDNIIPLCNSCHDEFDNPRTIEGYRKVFNIKKKLILQDRSRSIWHDHSIEKDISFILNTLSELSESDIDNILTYDPQDIDSKVDSSVKNIEKKRIKNNVSNYFTVIQKMFTEIEANNANSAVLISLQIKQYYEKQVQLKFSKIESYYNLIDWISERTKSENKEASELIASFFVQNCEVFGDYSK
jgi:hypothetical protein